MFRNDVLETNITDSEKSPCSDCVLVIHRIGEQLSRRGVDENSSSSSVNAFRKNATLWVELDCGTYFRTINRVSILHTYNTLFFLVDFYLTITSRLQWPACSKWIDDTQVYLDKSVHADHRGHYPNVPNLATLNWSQSYFGEEGYRRLLAEKMHWDPENIFHHVQSVGSSGNQNLLIKNEACNAIYKNNALRYLKKGLISLAVVFTLPKLLPIVREAFKRLFSGWVFPASSKTKV